MDILLLVLLVSSLLEQSFGKVGYFWQVTDFHYDPLVRQNGDVNYYCHERNKTDPIRFGVFGSERCDTPTILVDDAVRAMKEIEPNPDFLVWTGDTGPHLDDTRDINFTMSTLRFCTDTIKKYFPNKKTFAVIGNHDYFPDNQQPDRVNDFYKLAVEIWGPWLQNDAERDTLLNFGYYKYRFPNTNHLFFMVNSALWYQRNKANMTNVNDPGNQFKAIEAALKDARRSHGMVHIVNHIPPGVFELTSPWQTHWLHPQFNSRYIRLLSDYADVIGMQLYGHNHLDSFTVIRAYRRSPVVSFLLLAPAVTAFSGNNPAIRLVAYDTDTFQFVDIIQYYMNITEANLRNRTKWELEYRYSTAYNLYPPFTPDQFEQLIYRLESDDDLFQEYFKRNSAMYNMKRCDGECRRRQLCHINHSDFDCFDQCVIGNDTCSSGDINTIGIRGPRGKRWTQEDNASVGINHYPYGFSSILTLITLVLHFTFQ